MEYVEFKAATQATVTSPTFLSSTQSVQANSFFFFPQADVIESIVKAEYFTNYTL